MEKKYKSIRIVDGKPRKVVVDENGKIANRNPSKVLLKELENEPYKNNTPKQYTDKELLDYLIKFLKEFGRIPAYSDFLNNPEYPNSTTYVYRFGSWSSALKLAGLDVDTMVKNGILKTSNQKARFTEILVIDHFKYYSIDLAGENSRNPFDGICPNGKIYDVKSAAKLSTGYHFHTNNKYKEEIEIYYLLGFNSDWSKLDYAWRIPGIIVEKDYFYVGTTNRSQFNIINMEEYDITDKLIEIIRKYETME